MTYSGHNSHPQNGLHLRQRPKVGNDISTLLWLLEAGEGHLGAGHELLRVLKIDVEHLRGPDNAAVQVSLGVHEARNGAGVAADETVQVRADAVETAVRCRVALRSTGLEDTCAAGNVTLGKCLASLRWHVC